MNRPQPLANAPIPLLAEDSQQLSFGERAALEGILTQLWPRLAVEVGIAGGGTLRRLAEHCSEVHAFDIAAPPGQWPDNVELHIGDSHELLPAWLASHNRQVDFAFIDGDHSAAGVALDLIALLASAATHQTVILLHDCHNDDVRRGIEASLPHKRVVYAELDFIPGRTFAQGSFAGQHWGGLALIVTGAPEDGYGAQWRQQLYKEAA